MVAYRRLKNPPIVEALIDFRVRLRDSVDGKSLGNVSSEFKKNFPVAQLVRQHAFELKFEPGQAPNQGAPVETLAGVRFDSEAKDRVAIFTLDGFTFSHVKNYSDWGALKADARSAWAEFSELAQPKEIVRVGMRYINRLQFDTSLQIREILTAAPSLPPDLPQIMGPFQSRVLFPLPDKMGQGSLTHVLDQSITNEVSVILDIDIFQENTNFDASGDEAWDLLDKFREQKNNVFFASVTEKALEKYL
jgi:uncharacterized protein (TIGR04255 family)